MDGENNGKPYLNGMILGDPYFWKHPNLDMEHLEYSSLFGCIIQHYSCSPRYTLQGTNPYPTTREVRKIMGSKVPFGRRYVMVPRKRVSHVTLKHSLKVDDHHFKPPGGVKFMPSGNVLQINQNVSI